MSAKPDLENKEADVGGCGQEARAGPCVAGMSAARNGRHVTSKARICFPESSLTLSTPTRVGGTLAGNADRQEIWSLPSKSLQSSGGDRYEL